MLGGVGKDVSSLYGVIFPIFKSITEGLTAFGYLYIYFTMITDYEMAIEIAVIGIVAINFFKIKCLNMEKYIGQS